MPHKPPCSPSCSVSPCSACRRHAGAGARQAPAPSSSVPQQQSEIELAISGRAGRAAEVRGARLPRAHRRTRTRRRPPSSIGAGALGRPGVRARVLPDPARHLRVDSAGALADRCAVRSLERARRRRTRHRHACRRHATACCASRCACSACARGSRSSRASTAGRRRTRASSRTPIADEIHQQQRALRGVARTKLTFSSDRDRERVAARSRTAR